MAQTFGIIWCERTNGQTMANSIVPFPHFVKWGTKRHGDSHRIDFTITSCKGDKTITSADNSFILP